MKKCPKCKQLFSHRELRFCRYDGCPLVNESRPLDEATTLLFSTGQLNQQASLLDEIRQSSGRKNAANGL